MAKTKKIKVGSISAEQQLKMDRKARREVEIACGLNVNHHRVHKSQKTYTRKQKHRGRDF